MKNIRLSIVWIPLAIAFLAACVPTPTSLPTVSPTSLQIPTQAPTKTETSRPSATRTPVPPSVAPTKARTKAPTLTKAPISAVSTSTPRPTFAGFQVEFVEYAASYGMQFAFIIPGISQNYGLEVNGKAYTCNYYEKYPSKLFCIGPAIAARTVVKLSFFTLDGAKQEIYSTSYAIPFQITPTVDPTLAKSFTPDNCPVRGVNVRCETEYRVLGSGCCVVSTCVDACGYYYSVDTCPEGMPWEGICQGTPPVTEPSP